MGNTPIRIGVVGAGGICKSRHFPGFKKIEDCEIVAVCNQTQASSERIAKEFEIPEIEKNWKKLVKRKDINAVLIGTWPYLHADITEAALTAGKHVLCESRMALNAAHAHRMLKAAKKARKKHGLRTMLCPPPTGLRGDFVMKETIASGILGQPYQLYVRHMNASFLDPLQPRIWRQISSYQGLNALTLGMLNEPVQRWFGDTTKVRADTRIFIKKRPSAPGSKKFCPVERPDCISIIAQMKNGMQAVYMFSATALNSGSNVVEAYGSEGMIRYNLDTDEVFASNRKNDELKKIPVTEETARHWTVEIDFVNAIRNGTTVSPSFEEGVKYMDFTEAVAKSARTGKVVGISK